MLTAFHHGMVIVRKHERADILFLFHAIHSTAHPEPVVYYSVMTCLDDGPYST